MRFWLPGTERCSSKRGTASPTSSTRSRSSPRTLFPHWFRSPSNSPPRRFLQLQEEGKLSVTDKLSKYLSDYPHGTEVTRSPTYSPTLRAFASTESPDFADTVNQPVSTLGLVEYVPKLVRSISLPEPNGITATPITYFSPLSSKRSRDSELLRLLTHALTRPSRTQATPAFTAPAAALAHIAQGYGYLDGKVIPAVSLGYVAGAMACGAMYSTVEDLFRWNEALFHGKVLKPGMAGLRHSSPSPPAKRARPLRTRAVATVTDSFFPACAARRKSSTVAVCTASAASCCVCRAKTSLSSCWPIPSPVDPASIPPRTAHDTAEFYLGESLPARPANTGQSQCLHCKHWTPFPGATTTVRPS